jgi:hypothetical protein
MSSTKVETLLKGKLSKFWVICLFGCLNAFGSDAEAGGTSAPSSRLGAGSNRVAAASRSNLMGARNRAALHLMLQVGAG